MFLGCIQHPFFFSKNDECQTEMYDVQLSSVRALK